MAGSSRENALRPAMTRREILLVSNQVVMAGLDPAIHVLAATTDSAQRDDSIRQPAVASLLRDAAFLDALGQRLGVARDLQAGEHLDIARRAAQAGELRAMRAVARRPLRPGAADLRAGRLLFVQALPVTRLVGAGIERSLMVSTLIFTTATRAISLLRTFSNLRAQ